MKRFQEKVKKKLKEAVSSQPQPQKSKKKSKKSKSSSSAPKRTSDKKKNVAKQSSPATPSLDTLPEDDSRRKWKDMQARVSEETTEEPGEEPVREDSVQEVVEEPDPVGKEPPNDMTLESEAATLSDNAKSRVAYWHIALSRLKDDEKRALKELLTAPSSLPAVGGKDSKPIKEGGENVAFKLSDLDPGCIAELAAERVRRLDDKAWKFRFRGRDIILRDLANKITSWLGRFKEVGDIAVNYDPVHAALPWAAIRFLLQAATAEQELAGQMLIGTEKISYLLARCQVYRRLYLDKENGCELLALSQFEESLISLYSEILSLLAYLISLTNRSLARRGLHAMFSPAKLPELVEKLEKLERRIEMDASNCERESRSASDKAWHERYDAMQHLLNQHILLSEEERERFLDGCKANERLEILQWISDIPYEADHYNARVGRTEGTGEWLMADPIYRDWRTASASLCLWLHGKPGAGKTKLSTKVVDDLPVLNENKTSDEGIAYFYCDRNRANYRDPVWVLRSFVRQLSASQSHTTIAKCVRDKYIQMKRKGFASVLTQEDCTALLFELVNILPQTTLVLDGLDECEKSTRHTLMDALDDIMQKAKHPVKVFIASREDEDLANRYSNRDHLKVSASRNQADIEKFVWERMQRSRYCRTQMQPAIRSQILKTFREKSDGMFQWAALHIQELLDLERDHDIRRYLDSLPIGLKAAYDKIYTGIESQRGSKSKIAIAAMKWVVCANRPLSPTELVIAACQDPDEDFNEDIDIDPIYLLDACHNLIEVYEGGPTPLRFVSTGEATLIQRTLYPHIDNANISNQPEKNSATESHRKNTSMPRNELIYCRFSHLSVVEYLLAHKWDMNDLHAFAARVCFRTLMRFSTLEPLSRHIGFPMPRHYNVLNYWPLSKSYAHVELITRWVFDQLSGYYYLQPMAEEAFWVRSITAQAGRLDLLHLIYQAPQTWLLYAVLEWHKHAKHLMTTSIQDDTQKPLFDLMYTFFGHPVHGSAFYTAWVLLFNVLQSTQSSRTTYDYTLIGSQRFYPASWCAAIGFSIPLIKWIDEGLLDVNFASDGSDIIIALQPQHVQDSLKAHDPNYYIYSLLHTAIKNGQNEVSKILIKRGAKDTADGPWESALELAMHGCQNDIVKLLLDSTPDIQKTCQNRLLLHKASYVAKENWDTINLLIQKGADMNERVKFHHLYGALTPFEINCLHPYRNMNVHFFVPVLPDINIHHPMALRFAAMTNKVELAHYLIGMGADVEAPLEFNYYGDSDTFRLGETPLLAVTRFCLRARYPKSVDNFIYGAIVLLEHGADPNIVGDDGLTPLQMAVDQMNLEMVVALVRYGADATVKYEDGTTILQMACRMGCVPIAQSLIRYGADIFEVSGPWKTALFAAFLSAVSEKPFPERSYDNESGYKTQSSSQYDSERSFTDYEEYSDEDVSDFSERSQDGPSKRKTRLSFESGLSDRSIPDEQHNDDGTSSDKSNDESYTDSLRSESSDRGNGDASLGKNIDGMKSVVIARPRGKRVPAAGCLKAQLHAMLQSGKLPTSRPLDDEPGIMIKTLILYGARFRDECYLGMDEDDKQEVVLMKTLVQCYLELYEKPCPEVRELKDRFRNPFPVATWRLPLAGRRFWVYPNNKIVVQYSEELSGLY